MTKNQFVRRLKSAIKLRNHTQKDVATETGLNQSQVSRVLNREFARMSSETVRRLAQYANIDLTSDVRPEKSTILMAALKAVWDGSRAKEMALARLIKDLASLL